VWQDQLCEQRPPRDCADAEPVQGGCLSHRRRCQLRPRELRALARAGTSRPAGGPGAPQGLPADGVVVVRSPGAPAAPAALTGLTLGPCKLGLQEVRALLTAGDVCREGLDWMFGLESPLISQTTTPHNKHITSMCRPGKHGPHGIDVKQEQNTHTHTRRRDRPRPGRTRIEDTRATTHRADAYAPKKQVSPKRPAPAAAGARWMPGAPSASLLAARSSGCGQGGSGSCRGSSGLRSIVGGKTSCRDTTHFPFGRAFPELNSCGPPHMLSPAWRRSR